MWFFHHSPSGRRSLVGYRRSSSKLSTKISLFAEFSHDSSIAFPLPPPRSVSSTVCLPPSNNGDLEDSSTTTTVRPPSLPLGRISKSLVMLPLSSINTTSPLFMIFFVSKHISLYASIPSQYPRNMHLVFFTLNLPLFSSGTIAYARLPNTRMCATQGRLPLHISSGVTDVKAFVGHLFSVKTAFPTPSAQNDFSRFR